jgi:intracellular sulfur oxidation DsrE/DsrF family protein
MNAMSGTMRQAARWTSVILVTAISLSTWSNLRWSPALAADDAARAEHPFAEHRLVLQLSDDDPKKQGLVISVANNLLKFYGPDRIAIEVVTFGPGIDLLRSDSPNLTFVDSLVSQGVRFDVCMNTIDTITRNSGKGPQLNANARLVDTGVAQILMLTENGYTLVRP